MIITKPGSLLQLALMLLFSSGVSSVSAEPSSPQNTTATLHLANGDYVAGQLCDCDQAGILRWHGPAFAAPFDFRLNAVSTIRYPASAERVRPAGESCFELIGGDLLFGSLLDSSAEEAELQTSRFGRLHVRRSVIRRISPWQDGGGLVFLGPNSLSEWSEASPEGAWRLEGGHLVTDQKGAHLAGSFAIPAQASIEIEISWTTKPEFVLVLNTGREKLEHAPRLEVWADDLVFVCETEDGADLASVQSIAAGAGRCHLLLYLDGPRRQATVFAADGRLLATVKTDFNTNPTPVGAGGVLPALKQALIASATADPRPAPGLRLTNHRGNLRLEQLRIMHWDGELPRESASLPAPGDPPSRDLRAILHDGTRISGKLHKVEDGRVWLNCHGVMEPVAVHRSELQSLVVLKSAAMPSSDPRRAGRLEMENVELHGCLLDGNKQPEASCLIWQPRGSTTASPLKPSASGRIVYRDPPPPTPQPPAPVRAQRGRPQPVGILGRLTRTVVYDTLQSTLPPTHVPSLYLRTGDGIPCKVERIDQRGVTFESPMFDATFVPHDKIKAVELENSSTATKVTPSKRDRLITLPRMQKDDPPMHLIRSTEGDYLRGRLIAMDDKTLAVEVRAETKHLPRPSVARIIWLHEDDLDQPASPTSESKSATTSHVQAVRANGIRLTFVPEKLSGGTLCGTSDVLGTCRVDLGEIDQLILGHAIDEAVTRLPYQRWKLQHAVEPKFVQDAGDKGGLPGTESALVGKAAPDFELKTLDGQRFVLSHHRGKVVVLDFWATWCGPCMQTLPQLVATVKQCEDPSVLLVAVNLQETPKAITATLERLKLETTVVLDQDGVVAQKYAAVAIPQTVVIDPAGNVVRLFVGGGPDYANHVRDALQSILGHGQWQGIAR